MQGLVSDPKRCNIENFDTAVYQEHSTILFTFELFTNW